MISRWKVILLVFLEVAALLSALVFSNPTWYYEQPRVVGLVAAGAVGHASAGDATQAASSRAPPAQGGVTYAVPASHAPAGDATRAASSRGPPAQGGAALAAPWLRTAPVPSAILIDRHLHKNGGSTFRHILLANERAGVCQYWGYWQTEEGWLKISRELDRALLGGAGPLPAKLPWLCIEAHSSATTSNFMSFVVPYVVRLRQALALRSVPTRVLLVTRVREPFAFYLSFYKWKVAGLQRAPNGAKVYGVGFLGWTPPNLQAWSMLNGNIDSIASSVRSSARAHAAQFGQRQMAVLERKLAHFDIVTPLEYFDEHLLMVADAIGLPHIGYQSVSPPQMGIPKTERLSDAQVCPNMTACRERVRQVAPWDFRLYEKARADFAAKLGSQDADFQRRLELFRDSRHAAAAREREQMPCCTRTGKCHNKRTGEWLLRPPSCVPGWSRLQELVIDDRGGTCCYGSLKPALNHTPAGR
mmetsp:Transcript_27652/g.63605  ORF Transcript_27652/g.63605 Transcript_27652/m.63605 type:complete len:473 (-) Transcript_27652:82-1500(-)